MANFNQLASQTVQALMRDLNLTQEQAAGIVGQLAYESDGLQAINERSPVVPGSRGGFGWAQWTGPRRRDFENWANSKGLDVSDPAANYGFLLHELTNTPESRVLDRVRKTDNAKEAGQVFTRGYLRPGVVAQDKRDTWTDRVVNTALGAAEGVMNAMIPSAQASGGTQPTTRRSTSERIRLSREAGYSDKEIIEFLKDRPEFQDRMKRSVEAGYSENDVFKHLGLQIEPSESDSTASNQQPISEEGTGGNILYNEDRGFWGDLSHQAQLTGRYLVEGVASLPEMVVNPISQAFGGPQMRASDFLDAIGVAKPENATERIVGDVSRTVAGAGLPLGAAQQGTGAIAQALSAEPARQMTSAIGAGALGGLAREAEAPGAVQLAAGLAGGLIGGARLPSRKPIKASADSNLERLNEEAAELYARARESGRVATPSQTSGLNQKIRSTLDDAGAMHPDGTVMSSYSGVRDALRTLDHFNGVEMTVPQIQAARRTINNALGSNVSPSEKSVLMRMRNAFDDMMGEVAPEIKEANKLYSQVKKTEQLQQMGNIAEMKASSRYTQSGLDNALREQYRNLAQNIEKGKSRGWSPEEIQSINQVASGSPLGNAARFGGKFAPTSAIQALPGLALGGPAGAGIMGAGMLSRALSNNATRLNALRAEQLMSTVPGYTTPLIPNTAQNFRNPAILYGTILQENY